MIENRQLRYFVTAARLLHITRAAEALHIAQPALTRNIHQLEEELGVALFHRVHKRISLTEAGQTFLGEAERLLQQLEESATAAQKAARGELGRLVIGFVSTAGLVAVPKLIADFRNRYPGPRIVLKELESEELYEALRNGVVDVGLQYGPWEEGELSVRLLEADHFVAALPHDHRLATVDRVNLRDLADDFFVIPNRATGGPMTDAIVEECLLAGFRPRTGHEITTTTIQTTLGSGVGQYRRLIDSERLVAIFEKWRGVPANRKNTRVATPESVVAPAEHSRCAAQLSEHSGRNERVLEQNQDSCYPTSQKRDVGTRCPIAHLKNEMWGIRCHGYMRCRVLAKGMVSLTWSRPQTQATTRSMPMPKPECGTLP